jgi:glycosyltransferase involved in cell wall biosynthesis
MKKINFSVIIPTFNNAQYLIQAIDSVLDQIYPAYEIIVVDDGSTDGTKELIATKFKDKVIYFYQDNQGVAIARNLGAKVASGNWLSFLDSDDWYLPNRLKDHHSLIQGNQDIDLITSEYEYRQHDGTFISLSMVQHPVGRALLERNPKKEATILSNTELELFAESYFGDTHTLSVPKENFIAVGGYPAGFSVAEDVFLLLKLCSISKNIGVTFQPVAVYRIHNESVTKRDKIKAQYNNVKTLKAMNRNSNLFSTIVNRGISKRLLTARLHLGYVLLEKNKHFSAIKAVSPSLLERPSKQALRNFISMVIG